MTDLTHLLPEADDAPRCSLFTRAQGFAPAGTGVRADRLVLIECPLPWPMPIRDHRYLDGLMALLDHADRPSRIFAAVPTGVADTVRVVVFDRVGGGVARRTYRVPRQGDLLELVRSLLASDHAAVSGALVDETVPARTLLVCTQGTHDICCGSFGTRLAVEATAAFGDVEVFRVSHTGGHRFAPTAMTLPDGRMWAYLDVPTLASIYDETASPAQLAAIGRGWWGVDRGPAQVAEQAVFAAVGWSLHNHDRSVDVPEMPRLDGPPVVCAVSAGDRRWRVTVGVERIVPTISCRQPGGLPAKPASEYAVTSLESLR
ncbi:MAG: hypothetical protein HKN26_05165 [Acidimicrobiales bacterium]|nr:hypothetical protein [Acidimicrobiales bacterium]